MSDDLVLHLTEFDPTSYTGLTEVDLITNGCSAQSETVIDNNYRKVRIKKIK